MSTISPMTKHLTTLAGGVLLCGLVLGGPEVMAQATPGTSPGSPVDASIADRDPLAASFRWVEPGNAQFSFQNRLTVANFNTGWSPFDPGSPTATDSSTGLVHSQGYQFRSPGLRALIDRPEYVPVRGGGEAMIIPANTVFQLTLERPVARVDTRPAAHENFRDHRLNLRSNDPNSGSASPSSQAFPGLRLERVPVSELSPIPHPSQMRFPQAAFPNGWTEPAPFVVSETPTERDTPEVESAAGEDQDEVVVESAEDAKNTQTPSE